MNDKQKIAYLMLKLVLLGDSTVGKTSILNQFVSNEFTERYRATIGSDFSAKKIELDNELITLQIWDTAGQDCFQRLGPNFFRGTDCCILVYDVTNQQSFENIKKWRDGFIDQLGLSDPDDYTFLLLGNKADLPERAVQESTAREFASKNGDMLFYEVSAKKGENFQEIFNAVVEKSFKNTPKDEFQIPSSVVQLENNEIKRRKPEGKTKFIFKSLQVLYERSKQQKSEPKDELEINSTENKQEFEMQQEILKEEHKQQIEALKKDHIKMLEKINEEHQKQLEEKEEEHKKHLEEKEEEHDKQMEEKDEIIQKQKEEIARLTALIDK